MITATKFSFHHAMNPLEENQLNEFMNEFIEMEIDDYSTIELDDFENLQVD